MSKFLTSCFSSQTKGGLKNNKKGTRLAGRCEVTQGFPTTFQFKFSWTTREGLRSEELPLQLQSIYGHS